ncbi:MAG: cation:proton antiporter [Candidatus Nanopelagicales bacterium]
MLEHQASMTAAGGVAMVAVIVIAYNVFAKRLGGWNLTAPIVLMAAGLALSPLLGGGSSSHDALKVLAEVTLAIVLFTDAAGVRPREIGSDAGPVSRLLLIGLPLTIIFGTWFASVLWPAMPFAAVLLIGSALAPTDAALGAATVLNKAVPARVRRLLNVESGLNDGLATPVVLFAIAALAGQEGLSPRTSIVEAVVELAIGLGVGVAVGLGAGRALFWSKLRGLSSGRGRRVAVLLLPILAYALATVVSGNGFIAAFVGGTMFAAAFRKDTNAQLELAEGVADPLGAITWLAFGALIIPELLPGLDWRTVVFAVASLTVVRMLPVALSLIGAGFQPRTVAFVGWFGPRGLASVVFSLIALESLAGNEMLSQILATTTLTIILSVVLHGITAGWGARTYGAWADATRPPAETAVTSEPSGRGPMAAASHPAGD